MRTLVLSTVLTAGLAGPAPAWDCVGMLRMHDFLRRGSTVCTFERCNPEIVQAARRRLDALAPRGGARSIYAGADEFDRIASLRGTGPAYADIKRPFPMAVGKDPSWRWA
jgi:hypothetical protein